MFLGNFGGKNYSLVILGKKDFLVILEHFLHHNHIVVVVVIIIIIIWLFGASTLCCGCLKIELPTNCKFGWDITIRALVLV